MYIIQVQLKFLTLGYNISTYILFCGVTCCIIYYSMLKVMNLHCSHNLTIIQSTLVLFCSMRFLQQMKKKKNYVCVILFSYKESC